MKKSLKLLAICIFLISVSCKKETIQSTNYTTPQIPKADADINFDAALPAYTIRTIAGAFQQQNNESHYVNGSGPQARFWKPHGITVALDGSIYVADYFNNAVRKITIQNNVYTVPLSYNTQTGGGLLPEAVGFSNNQTFYIVSTGYGIRIYNKNKGIDIYSRIANSDSNLDLERDVKDVMWFVNDNSLGRKTGTTIQRNVVNFSALLAPNETLRGIATAPLGVKYISSATQLFKVDNDGKITKLFPDQKFTFISGIAVTKDGATIYIADGNAVKMIYKNNITLISQPLPQGDGRDGIGLNADVVAANIALSNSEKKLFVTDTRNTIRAITLP